MNKPATFKIIGTEKDLKYIWEVLLNIGYANDLNNSDEWTGISNGFKTYNSHEQYIQIINKSITNAQYVFVLPYDYNKAIEFVIEQFNISKQYFTESHKYMKFKNYKKWYVDPFDPDTLIRQNNIKAMGFINGEWIKNLYTSKPLKEAEYTDIYYTFSRYAKRMFNADNITVFFKHGDIIVKVLNDNKWYTIFNSFKSYNLLDELPLKRNSDNTYFIINNIKIYPFKNILVFEDDYEMNKCEFKNIVEWYNKLISQSVSLSGISIPYNEKFVILSEDEFNQIKYILNLGNYENLYSRSY